MPWWEALLDGFGAVALLLVLAFGFLFGRRRWISRPGSTFECSVRPWRPLTGSTATSARGWTLGVGRYTGETLEWFRIFSFSPRPRHVFPRSMTVVGRRTPHGPETYSLYAGHRIIDVQLAGGARMELAMSESAVTGFLAWTEAAPPGHDRLHA